MYQKKDSFLPDNVLIPVERIKPWGTAHAVLSAKDAIMEPFAVINADDFYGREAFEKAAAFLVNKCNENTYSIIGYKLAKTLSDNGTVSRGVCEVNENGNLESIKERIKIYREGNTIIYEDNVGKHEVPFNSIVSMNFWCFSPTIFAATEKQFHVFVKENYSDIKAEFFIPMLGDEFVQHQHGNIKVILTSAKWFGVTYKEDAPFVKSSLDKLIANKEYPVSLWSAKSYPKIKYLANFY